MMDKGDKEFLETKKFLGEFDVIHHRILCDLITLISISLKYRDKEDEYNSMFRSIVRSFFSLIEADLFYLNVLDKYDNYTDRENFYPKLKKTYKQVAKTLNREKIQKSYFDTKLGNLKKLKQIRNNLVHPKNINHLHFASKENFLLLNTCIEDYQNFIVKLMKGFILNSTISLKGF